MTPFENSNLQFVLRGKKILIGITGSIAAFKSCDIVRFLRSCGAEVRVVLSAGGENFVTPTTLETLSGFPVLTGFWNSEPNSTHRGTHHIDTARWADLILVAPATAHCIGKIAHGLADDLLTTEILAAQVPLLIAPAMNPAMFAHPAVQENITCLKNRGTRILGPSSGMTACGEEGLGRMLEPREILHEVARALAPPSRGQKMVITLGPTRSALDPVRYLSNRSSGLMGASLCWAAQQAGYEVVAISGPAAVEFPSGISVISVQTAEEMAKAVQSEWPQADVFVSTAAVLDWSLKNPSPRKLKKEDGPPQLEFEQTLDILKWVGENRKSSQTIVGFAAETEHSIENATQKLKQKKCDAIFANDVSQSTQGFESELNEGWWITSDQKPVMLAKASKVNLARTLIELIQNLR